MNSIHFASAPAELLKRTTSRCPACHAPCPASVVKRDGKVYLERECAAHGEFSACIASDSRFYWLALGDEKNRDGSCCSGGACCSANGETAGTLGKDAAGRGDNPIETLSTCLALIEIVISCNL
ncbi:MAG: radical SAM protein, partial [Verrucomicrobiaceae bacterium]